MSPIGLWTQEQGSLLAQVIPVVAIALGLETREATRQMREYHGMLEREFARLHEATAISKEFESAASDRILRSKEESGSAAKKLLASKAEFSEEYLSTLESSMHQEEYASAESVTAQIWSEYARAHLEEMLPLAKLRGYPVIAYWIGSASSVALLILGVFELIALRSALGVATLNGLPSLGLGMGLCIAFLMPAWAFVTTLHRKPQLTSSGKEREQGIIVRHPAVSGLMAFIVVCAIFISLL